MMSEWERHDPLLEWPAFAERLLERVPGVVSAEVEGAQDAVSAVQVWYEPTWPVGQVVDAVYDCLTRRAKARLAGAKVHAIVAQPDRRVERRARPEPRTPVASERSQDTPLRLVGHKLEEVRHGVVGVEVWIEVQGRTFSGAAVGPYVPPGSLRTPALATLRALHSCLQILYNGPLQPGLVLENAVQITVADSPVAVVALTASENARPRTLTAAWADEGATDLAVILATLHATSRTVTRWLSEGKAPEVPRYDARLPTEGWHRGGASPGRFTLVKYDVDHDPSGTLDVAVRLSGFGEAVDRSRNGDDSEEAHLQLGAAATLEAVYDLLRIGGWDEQHEGDLRHAGARRLRTGEQDIVVVLAEALMNGHRVPLAGATSADEGLERAAIAATLQATNGLVADRTAAMRRSAPLARTNGMLTPRLILA